MYFYNVSIGLTNITETDNDGKCLTNGKYMNKHDCSKYYQCVKGKQPEEGECKQDRLFSLQNGEVMYY